MRTIKEWNKIIENYFNENNIEYDRNYLCFFPEINFIKVFFDKNLFYDFNKFITVIINVFFFSSAHCSSRVDLCYPFIIIKDKKANI